MIALADTDRADEIPPEPDIAPVVRRLAATPGVVAVVLLGSAARGELAKAVVGGRLELFSDLEFLAATAGRLSPEARRSAVADIERIAAGFGFASRLFHVDVLFRERRRLGALPPFVFTYELAARGRTVFGPDLRDEIRPVNLRNLDRRNTREILMKRLWAIAEGLPAAWVRGEPLPEIDARGLGVALRRNPLDVTTVLLPEAGVLLPSYGERVSYWADHPELPFRTEIDRALDQDSGAFLSRCASERLAAAPAIDPDLAYADAIILVAAALRWLGWRPAAPRRHPFFNERPVTRGEWLAARVQTVRIAYTCGPASALRWSTMPRKAGLCAGLLHLHTSLLAARRGKAGEAQAHLDQANAALAPLACPEAGLARACTAGAPFPARWLAVRALAGRAFWRTIRLGEPAAWGRMARAIEWDKAVV